ncbi:unnamed protein product [Rhizophagus irregularis]|nr:unnamed protein product [Rhizophagus irregularis]
MEARTTQKIFAKFGELLDNGLGSDVVIEVAFSSNWVNRFDGIIHFEKPNISPNIFKIILNFIYKADLDLKKHKASDICSLIKASDELSIDVLNEHILENKNKIPAKVIRKYPAKRSSTMSKKAPITMSKKGHAVVI